MVEVAEQEEYFEIIDYTVRNYISILNSIRKTVCLAMGENDNANPANHPNKIPDS